MSRAGFHPRFRTDLFRSEADRPRSEQGLRILLGALVELDRLYLAAHPQTPTLYAAGVRYRAEPPGQEEWLDVPHALAAGHRGAPLDCEDLAAWRVAELRNAGIDARPIFRARRLPGKWVYHILVGLPDGTTEDPSRRLGMGRNREWGGVG